MVDNLALGQQELKIQRPSEAAVRQREGLMGPTMHSAAAVVVQAMPVGKTLFMAAAAVQIPIILELVNRLVLLFMAAAAVVQVADLLQVLLMPVVQEGHNYRMAAAVVQVVQSPLTELLVQFLGVAAAEADRA